MFTRITNASKVAFVTLVQHLLSLNFTLIDCQITTGHLISFGAREIPRSRYLKELEEGLRGPTLRGKWVQLYLWQSQNGVCPVCEEKLTGETDWDRHHVVQRVHGGPDTIDNLVLLHPTCHRQVHSLGSPFYHRVLSRGVSSGSIRVR